MSDQVTAASIDQTPAQSVVDRDLARVLALRGNDHAGRLTIADFRERGVQAPALAVYMLKLADYDIDRVQCEHPNPPATRRVLGLQERG